MSFFAYIWFSNLFPMVLQRRVSFSPMENEEIIVGAAPQKLLGQ